MELTNGTRLLFDDSARCAMQVFRCRNIDKRSGSAGKRFPPRAAGARAPLLPALPAQLEARHGCFYSSANMELMDAADIVATNPPLSLPQVRHDARGAQQEARHHRPVHGHQVQEDVPAGARRKMWLGYSFAKGIWQGRWARPRVTTQGRGPSSRFSIQTERITARGRVSQ